jgi:hypothetical protein
MDASAAKRSMVFGGIIFIVGLVITVGSFTAGAPEVNSTQRHVVAAAAMIFGGIRFVYGS